MNASAPGKANASPSKLFFCRMLTRDIELKDAIMDLIDNCLDGAMRTKGIPPAHVIDDYYKGFRASVFFEDDTFSIADNCGGISRKTAETYAFRFGPPEESSDREETNLPTVGIYGIGMKRAIFKMGLEAEIVSRTSKGDAFRVAVPDNWIETPDWEFELRDIEESEFPELGCGTKITISKLNEETKREFSTENFKNSLRLALSKHFSIVLQRGFELTVNGEAIEAERVSFLFSEPSSGGERYAPYIYNANIQGVEVRLIVGFYGKTTIPDETVMEEEAQGKPRSSDEAGWTVVCNDRVVLYNNRDHLTGWGEAGVPKYHTQFIGIKGMVIFRSDKPDLLPTTTSKRGIDQNSALYSRVKDKMREGLKIFTDYTNKWKGRQEEERRILQLAKIEPISSFVDNPDNLRNRLKIELKEIKRSEAQEYRYKPNLPEPPKDVRYQRISFSKPEKEIKAVADFLTGGEAELLNPKQVGERCFERVLDEARKVEG